MNMVARTGRRLLTALEKLAAEEFATARSEDLASLADIQDRIEAVQGRLIEMANPAPDRQKIAAVLAIREETRQLLAKHSRGMNAELVQLRRIRGRLREMAPVYGSGSRPVVSSRLNTAA